MPKNLGEADIGGSSGGSFEQDDHLTKQKDIYQRRLNSHRSNKSSRERQGKQGFHKAIEGMFGVQVNYDAQKKNQKIKEFEHLRVQTSQMK